MKSKNRFFERDGHMFGVTKKGVEFIFDEIDYGKVSQHTWSICEIKGNQYISTRVIINGKKTTRRLHQIILGHFDGLVIDHINHNCLDNRRENLRVCSHRRNICNSTKRNIGTSTYKGVYYFRKARRWVAQIQVHGKKKYLGIYDNEIDAAVAYNTAAAFYFGEYAHLNKIA